MAGPLTTVPCAKDTIFLDKGLGKLRKTTADCPDSMQDRIQHGHDDSTQEVTFRGSSGPWVVEIGLEDGGWAQASLEPDRPLILGSSRDTTLTLADRAVSARHCALHITERGVVVEDLNSKNGVFVG